MGVSTFCQDRELLAHAGETLAGHLEGGSLRSQLSIYPLLLSLGISIVNSFIAVVIGYRIIHPRFDNWYSCHGFLSHMVIC